MLRTLAAPRPHRDSPDLPYDTLRPMARTIGFRVEAFDPVHLKTLAEAAWGLVDQHPPIETVNLLIERCELASTIVDDYLSFFGVRP